jgi:hypothetical protein
MRFYTIQITPNPTVGADFEPIVYTSVGFLGDNYSCLQVDLDIYQAPFHQPAPLGSINIYGVSFDDLNQSTNLVGSFIQVFAGMTPGLPLADPSQLGLLVSGTILQSFGNWQGTNVALSLIITSSDIDPNNSVNLALDWQVGTPLDAAVKLTLEKAYTGAIVLGEYSPNLIYTETQTGMFPTLESFSNWVYTTSKAINPAPEYLGASIIATSTGILLTDGTIPSVPLVTYIKFTDLIGNITWKDQATIQVKVVMRADLEIGQYITFPPYAPVINTASFAQARNKTAFQGIFTISQLRHQGFSRQADANSWVTIIEATLPGVPLELNFDFLSQVVA